MKIEEIRIKNFRSFGEKEMVFKPNAGLNIIIGQNNAGKSNIFLALDKLRKVLISTGFLYPQNISVQKPIFVQDDWYSRRDNMQIKICVALILDVDEIQRLVNLVSKWFVDNTHLQKYKGDSKLDGYIDRLKMDLSKVLDRVEIALFHQKESNDLPQMKMNYFSLEPSQNMITVDPVALRDSRLSCESVTIGDITHKYYDSNRTFSDIITEYSTPYNISCDNLPLVITEFLISLFDSKLKIFDDIRQRPCGKDEVIDESLDGAGVSDVLNTLKNADKKGEDKFILIVKKFNLLFPNLTLRSGRGKEYRLLGEQSFGKEYPTTNITICCENTGCELPISSMGAGVSEILTFLANIIASENNIFVVQEPELHLHPSSQRLLLDLLNEYKENNQIFVISHSPYFVDVENITDNILVRNDAGKTVVRQVPEDTFDSKDLAKLEQNLDIDNAEIFFSKKVLLVEGETEVGALPISARGLDEAKDFNKNNISVVWVGGKERFEIFIRLLNAFKIPYLVMCDYDAVMEIGRGGIPSLFKQLENLSVLSNGEVKRLKEIPTVMVHKKNKKGDKIKVYSPDRFEELEALANKYCCFPLSSDFETVLENGGYKPLLEKAQKEVGDSKPRKGRYVAREIIKQKRKPEEAIPEEFVDIINRVIEEEVE